jgi:nitroimidazol reductase NimA-like FMN-containing flavoprotein (pyridoxamine 5'-phosphate oxidase superfamily)
MCQIEHHMKGTDTLDEPELQTSRAPDRDGARPTLPQRIRSLLEGQPYGVLCTQGGGQPYGSLVAFAFSDDLTRLFFATAMTTRKFRLLSTCERVAMVVDSRATHGDDLTRVEAVTVTGRASSVDRGPGYEDRLDRLSNRHVHLRRFFKAPTTALVSIDVTRYLHVSRFQDVSEWAPVRGG